MSFRPTCIVPDTSRRHAVGSDRLNLKAWDRKTELEREVSFQKLPFSLVRLLAFLPKSPRLTRVDSSTADVDGSRRAM